MYWYGQALREPMEFIGLVHAGVALDVLARGSYDRGITDLCSRLIDIDPDKAITPNGLSLRKIVQLIYKEGRSQFSHGGRLALLSDLPYGRDAAVYFTSTMLAECGQIELVQRIGRVQGFPVSYTQSVGPTTPSAQSAVSGYTFQLRRRP